MDFMDSPIPPRFTVGQELARFLASSETLDHAWEEIQSVSTNNVDSFGMNEYDGVTYVTFPSVYMEDFVVSEGRYGDCDIQNGNRVFSASFWGQGDDPALVHKGALNRFLQQSLKFEAQMERFLKPKKEQAISEKEEQAIIIVGHSMGGAVATLATLWLLGKREKRISPFCITFGSPLVGNARLGEKIGREGWLGNFCHVVSKYDIVPRMFLAPFESIAEPLMVIVPHWRNIMGIESVDESHISIQEARRILLNNVLKCTSMMANNDPGESGHKSPYKPFGTYMFCSTQGAACIEDSEAVLKMLLFTLQSKEGSSFDQIAAACISEHPGYDNMLEVITENLHNAMKVADFVSESAFEMGTALELEAMGVGAQNGTLIALREAGNLKYKHDMNIEKLNDELSKSQSYMAGLEWYKLFYKACGYCDAFRQNNNYRDFDANIFRNKLGTFWDDIVGMVEKHELPSDFQTQNKWINAGNAYRKLVEPLDIVDYYYREKGDRSYLSDGVRPHRHIVLEKWLKEKNQTRIGREKKPRTKFASLTQDSCFWARLEEACKDLRNLQQEQTQYHVANAQQLKESLTQFEDYMGSMIRDKNISVEVFLEGSSFMIWWQQYKNLQLETLGWQASSPLFNFIENEKWKL